MRITLLPKTCIGKWSCWLIVAFGVFLGIFFLMVEVFSQRGGDVIFDNLLLAIPMLIACGSAIAAAVTGIISFIKKERAVLTLISVIIGLFILLTVIMQFA